MNKQRTSGWLKEREGRFTGSEIWKLFVKGRSKSDYFGEVARTYIREKAIQELTGYRQSFSSHAMQHGIDHEPVAISLYELSTGNIIRETGFHAIGDHLGGSPDGIIEDYPSKGIIEVKCPLNPDIHFKYLRTDDLLVAEKKYYYQIQCNLFCTGMEYCDFITYHPHTPPLNMGILQIEVDDLVIQEMLERVEMAAKLKKEYVKEFLMMLDNNQETIMRVYTETRDVPFLLSIKDFQ